MVPFELFREALEAAGLEAAELPAGSMRAIVVPGLSGRVFVREGERILHRFDHACVLRPTAAPGVYDNYGGLNVWPAPEGGEFGWTYTPEGVWHVQSGVNEVPFSLVRGGSDAVRLQKETRITNRKGACLEVRMDRAVSMRPIAAGPGLAACAVTVSDSFVCEPDADVLIAPWTLEQFDTSDEVVSFCRVERPKQAVNFDYYEPPHERLRYGDGWLVYATDGRKAGQIGIRASSRPRFIGTFDPQGGLLVERRILSKTDTLRYLNIADNDQPGGPFSAADTYSIYNSPGPMRFLELETIGGCAESERGLIPQTLVSETKYTIGPPEALRELLSGTLGIRDGTGGSGRRRT